MVTSSDKPPSGENESLLSIPKAEGLPVGNYRLVGWDLDYTGRRLVDEILQIAAYTPEKHFSMYMMPCRDLNMTCRRRHKLKVVTVYRYRVLKPLNSNKPIKTKSEISGLLDFISWLEEVKGDAKDGVILVCHENFHHCPSLLLHCLGRYPHTNLLERFKAVVAGFASGYAIAEQKCAKTVNQFTLRTLSTVLLGKDEALDSAAVRAHLAYQVMQQVCSEDSTESNSGAGDALVSNVAHLASCVREFSQPTTREEDFLRQQEDIIKRQDALKPIFIPMMSTTRKERERASVLRRNFVNANIDMAQIKEAWEAGKKEAIEQMLVEKVGIADEKDRQDVGQLIEWFFIPELRPAPEPRPKTDRRPVHLKRGKKVGKQGSKSNGEVTNGEAASGEAASGDAASGDAANGDAANGEAANGEAANGEAANGEASLLPDRTSSSPKTDVSSASDIAPKMETSNAQDAKE